MDKVMIKNIDKSEVLMLKDLVSCKSGEVVSRTLAQNGSVSLTLFAFGIGEQISSHTSHGDAMITVLEGAADITIGDKVYRVSECETIVMPAEVPHAVDAPQDMKFLLTVVF